MPKKKNGKTNTRTTASKVAEKAKPNWRAVEEVSNDFQQGAAETNSPEIEQLKRKYLGDDSATGRSKKSPKGDLKIVIMEEKHPTDTRAGRKAVLVEKGKVVGEQG